MKDSTSAESRTTWEARTRTFWISKSVLSVAPAGCAPAFLDHSAVVASANSISITRFSCGGSIFPQRRMPAMVGRSSTSAAALVHRAGRPRVVHLVEALHGLVLVVLAALQQVMHGRGAAVVVMLSQRWPLAKTWILWMKQAGFGVAGASGLVDSEGHAQLQQLGCGTRTTACPQRRSAAGREAFHLGLCTAWALVSPSGSRKWVKASTCCFTRCAPP